MKKYAMMILGCKVNDYEAHYLKDQLDKDYQEVSFNEEADIYVVFTCCVTNIAESKTRKFIHRVKREHPNAYLVTVGCYVQSKPNDEVFKDVDLIVGSYHKDKIKDYIDKGIKANLYEDRSEGQFENLFIDNYKGKTRSYLKVEDGCNQFCSYCIIPYARGRERSGDFDTLIKQAKTLAKNTKEIVLTGIHTGRYKDNDKDLAALLEELIKIEGLETIRLSSIEITEVNDRILKLMKESDKIAHHLHIPLQAGSDEVLKDMNRPYTTADFYKAISHIREEIPDILISTDLIVGFPSESDELFLETSEFIKKLQFSFIHCFPYAKKEGTKASLLKQLDQNTKKKRAKEIEEIQNKITKDIKKTYINKEVVVLVETFKDGFSFGHSKEYLPIYIMGKIEQGSLVKVKITNYSQDRLIAEVI